MKTRIVNGKVFNTEKKAFEERSLYFDDKICEGGIALKTIDAKGAYVLPGFIDVHTHGREGIDIMCAGLNDLRALSFAYAKTGVTTVFPTVMTAPLDQIQNAIAAIKATQPVIRFPGIHIEGPYIDTVKRGCHAVSYIRRPTQPEVLDLVERVAPLHAHFTIAPDHDDSDVIPAVIEAGASVGIGHTSCDAETARAALRAGAVSFTHTFNAMPSFLHRAPGPIGVALASSAYAEFICDGIHLAPDTVAAAYNAKLRYGDKFVLITDSIPAAGLPNGDYNLNGLAFTLEDGKAFTSEGVIVGSALDIPSALRNLMRFCDISLEEALLCATKAPAEMMGLYDVCGSLTPGKAADIVLTDENLNVQMTLCAGRVICERIDD